MILSITASRAVMLSITFFIVMLSVIMLSVIMQCHYSECHYAECHYAESHYAECQHAEWLMVLQFVELFIMTSTSEQLTTMIPLDFIYYWKESVENFRTYFGRNFEQKAPPPPLKVTRDDCFSFWRLRNSSISHFFVLSRFKPVVGGGGQMAPTWLFAIISSSFLTV